MIKSVAIIGKENSPLFIKVFEHDGELSAAQRAEEEVEFASIAHCALDVIEERDASDTFLGLLYPTNMHLVYGYVTSTNVKFVLVLQQGEVKDNDVKVFFKRLHTLYAQLASDPFYNLDEPITSKLFQTRLDKLAAVF